MLVSYFIYQYFSVVYTIQSLSVLVFCRFASFLYLLKYGIFFFPRFNPALLFETLKIEIFFKIWVY